MLLKIESFENFYFKSKLFYQYLHPIKNKYVGNLLLMSNKFGQCVAGSCEPLNEDKQLIINCAVVNFICRDDDFLNIESMGVCCYPACGNCKCERCSIGSRNCTIKEEREQRKRDGR